ncbi:MAG: hypothetical protein U0166_15975 [Acidobacteriota bacterium]
MMRRAIGIGGVCGALLLSSAIVRAGEPKAGKALSDEELKKLSEEVRTHCNLPKESDPKVYPWYFHYELGVALGEKEDWGRMAEAITLALEKREDPAEHGRTYGMWFLAYRPYFQLGFAQYQLGKYECAATSFKLSEKLGEFLGDRTHDAECRERGELRKIAEEKAAKP